MIGIDTVPTDDAPTDDAPKQERAEPLVENPEDLLRRLEEEKQEWRRQLAAMKEALEAQDKKIEEDRSKRKQYLEKEEKKRQDLKQVVPAKAAVGATAPPRKYVVNLPGADPLGASPTIPTISERTHTIWPGIAEFHNRRARGVAKVVPTLAGEMYINSLGPTRYLQNPGGSALSPSSALAPARPQDVLRAHNSQEFTVDSMGRVSRQAKVLNVIATDSGSTLSTAIAKPVPGIAASGSSSTLASAAPATAGLAGALVATQQTVPLYNAAYGSAPISGGTGALISGAGYPASPVPDGGSWSSWIPFFGSNEPAPIGTAPIVQPVAGTTQYRLA